MSHRCRLQSHGNMQPLLRADQVVAYRAAPSQISDATSVVREFYSQLVRTGWNDIRSFQGAHAAGRELQKKTDATPDKASSTGVGLPYLYLQSRRIQGGCGMKLTRRDLLGGSAGILSYSGLAANQAQDPLPSWNAGAAKQGIVDFARATTDRSSPNFVPLEERIAVFDQDGTLWVEHPMYTQLVFCLDRVPKVVRVKPDLADAEPFKTVISGNRDAIAKLSMDDLVKVLGATLTGMSVDEFRNEVKQWLLTARDSRWKRPYTKLAYAPMIELLKYLRTNGYKTYIVTGGGQDFVRVYANRVYGIPPEQVVGTAAGTTYGYGKDGRPFLTRDPKLLLNDNDAGKPEAIHLMIGRRPYAAVGNSTGDRQMLEYTKAGSGERLAMLVLHDDAQREYAYGPAQGLPDTKVGTFTQALYDEAKSKGWIVISMKNDWKRILGEGRG